MTYEEIEDLTNIKDGDETTKSIDEEFTLPFHLTRSLTFDDAYILNVDFNCDGSKLLVFGSNGEACICSPDLQKLSCTKTHTEAVSQAAFAKCDANLFYTSSYDGTIKLWDIRDMNTCKLEFKDSSTQPGPPSSSLKPILCFDTSPTNSIVCAGTEQVGADSYLLFWDARSANQTGGYWESHSDDITTVKFNSERGNCLASGDSVGNVNVFDINQSDEDEALQTSFNADDSVAKMTWFKKNGQMDYLAITTHSEELQVFETEETLKEQSSTFTRKNVAHSIRRLGPEHVFIVDVIEHHDQGFLLLAGSNYENDKCLRFSLLKSKKLKPYINLPLDLTNRGHTRCCVELPGGFGYVTGSEGGVVDLWKPGSTAKEESMKISKKSDRRSKPY